ncbi:MAG: pyrroline-5-carboxylate reductase [Actinomycetota bacterium]|nr:pyrroline-5-carboxylate reductase [Actinomycetota bacterium]
MSSVEIEVIGGGRMGTALLSGLVDSRWCAPEAMAVVELDAARRASLSEELPGVRVVAEPLEAPAAILAVKPADAESACRSLASLGAPVARVVSIVAGTRTRAIESWVAPGTAVVRAMPNTPALVRAGVTAIARGSSASEQDLAWAEEVMAKLGRVVRVGEDSLDAVTGLSGSGPAYVFVVVEALAEAGVMAGLPREVSEMLAVGTVVGAGRLLEQTGRSPEALRVEVTSPGGTTAAGLRALEARAVRSAFMEAVVAATERSRELGR